MSDDIRSSTCCPSETTDSPNGLFSYAVDGTTAHPPPEVTCPENFNAWLIGGEYVVPDFSSAVVINGLCAVDSEFTIVQNPPAGTVISIGGDVVIVIIVTDRFGNEVECEFTVSINDPSVTPGSTVTPPTIIPPWVYRPFLFAYWAGNDTLCTVGATDEPPPCWFRRDLSGYLGNASPRHLSNAGDAILTALESAVADFGPGPVFHMGSIYSGNMPNAYLYHADDIAMRLVNQDFTIRFWFKLVELADGGVWPLVSKFNTVGYRVKVTRSGSEYRLSAEVKNGSTTISPTYWIISLNTWVYVAVTFNASIGRLRMFVDGELVSEAASAGFILSGESSQFRIGDGGSSATSCPAAYWTLDTTGWLDSMGVANLTASGTVNSIAGKISNGAEFPVTTGGRLSFTEDSLSALKLLNTDFTLRFWVRVPSSPNNPGQIIGRRAAGAGWAARLTGPSDPFDLDFLIGGAAVTSTASLAINTWYHVVWRYRVSDGLLECIVDTVAAGGASGMTVTDASAIFYIGMENAFVGPLNLDEVGIWNHRFSDAEIAADYNSGTGTGFLACIGAICYHDEIGIWGQEWSEERVATDHTLMTL